MPYWLRVEDGTSMGVSIETRVPYLDHVLIEAVFAWPEEEFLAGFRNKSLLRRAGEGMLPAHVANQAKNTSAPAPPSGSSSNPCRRKSSPRSKTTIRPESSKRGLAARHSLARMRQAARKTPTSGSVSSSTCAGRNSITLNHSQTRISNPHNSFNYVKSRRLYFRKGTPLGRSPAMLWTALKTMSQSLCRFITRATT